MLYNNMQTSCPAEALAALLGRKWVPQLLELLEKNPKRFGELTKSLEGSTPKMIKQQLSLLEEEHIIENHKVEDNNQVQSTYRLTEKGHSLVKIVKQMKHWGLENLSCDSK